MQGLALEIGLALNLFLAGGAAATETYEQFATRMSVLAVDGAQSPGDGVVLPGSRTTTVADTGTMTGTPWLSAIRSAFATNNRVVQHGLPSQAEFNAQVASGFVVLYRMVAVAQQAYSALNRNGFLSSAGASAATSLACNALVYWDGTQAQFMNPQAGIGPTPFPPGSTINDLDLDFGTGRYALNGPSGSALPPGWSYTGTGSGRTALDLSGNVVAIADGQPRITNRGLLVEEARTNVLLISNEFDNASWSLLNTTVSANAAAAPDGTTTADKIVATAANAQHRADQTAVNSAGTACFSVFLKAAEYGFATIRIGANGGTINLSDGTVSGVSVSYTLTATAVANGWYRCVLVGAAALNDVVRINVQNATGFALSFAGDGTSGVFAWGAQLELGSFATSPIITTGAAATRGVERPDMTIVFPAEGTIIIDYEGPPTGTVTRAYGWGIDDAGNDRLALRVSDVGFLNQPLAGVGDGTTLSSLTLGVATTPVQVSRVAVAYSTTTARAVLAQNGALTSAVRQMATSGLAGGIVGIGQLGGNNPMNSYIRRFRILPYSASDAELQALTA